MESLNDEIRLQVDENKNLKNEKCLKLLKMYNIIIFQTLCSNLAASGNIIHPILIHKLMGPVSLLFLPKE